MVLLLHPSGDQVMIFMAGFMSGLTIAQRRLVNLHKKDPVLFMREVLQQTQDHQNRGLPSRSRNRVPSIPGTLADQQLTIRLRPTLLQCTEDLMSPRSTTVTISLLIKTSSPSRSTRTSSHLELLLIPLLLIHKISSSIHPISLTLPQAHPTIPPHPHTLTTHSSSLAPTSTDHLSFTARSILVVHPQEETSTTSLLLTHAIPMALLVLPLSKCILVILDYVVVSLLTSRDILIKHHLLISRGFPLITFSNRSSMSHILLILALEQETLTILLMIVGVVLHRHILPFHMIDTSLIMVTMAIKGAQSLHVVIQGMIAGVVQVHLPDPLVGGTLILTSAGGAEGTGIIESSILTQETGKIAIQETAIRRIEMTGTENVARKDQETHEVKEEKRRTLRGALMTIGGQILVGRVTLTEKVRQLRR